MKILIIGASGLVGHNCMNHFRAMGETVVGTYFSYAAKDTVFFDTLTPLDVKNYNCVAFAPDVIVHCGALTFVDYCEQHPGESYEKTVISTENVISIARDCGAKMVFISTDYIFDGKDGPYLEDAAPNAISIYGQHKLEAEQLVLADIPGSIVLRITNVYGDEERGKNFVSRIIEQAINKQKITLRLPADQYATPVNAFDVARVIYLLLSDHKRGVYHIAGTDYMNRVQLAQTILKYFPGADYDLQALPTTELGQPAPRPLQGGLKPAKFLKEYPTFQFTNVDDYLMSVLARKKK